MRLPESFPRPPWRSGELGRKPRIHLGGREWFTIPLPRRWRIVWRAERVDTITARRYGYRGRRRG